MKNSLLIVNLGTPAEPTTQAVKQYLKVFLSDPNVIQMPKWLWQPILNHIILPTRSWRSATFYQHIWQPLGSPLMQYTELQAQQIQTLLPDWQVSYAMTYGQPSIAGELHKLQNAGVTTSLSSHFFHNIVQQPQNPLLTKSKPQEFPHK